MRLLCFVGAWRVGADSVRRGVGVGVCVCCVSWERTTYGAARGGRGLWYVFVVFRGSGLGTAWRRGRGLCLLCFVVADHSTA